MVRLYFEFAPLFERRVLLFVHVDHFLSFDEELGPRSYGLVVCGVYEGFGERGEAFGWIDDEGWVRALRFEVVAAELVEEAREGGVVWDGEGEVVEYLFELG